MNFFFKANPSHAPVTAIRQEMSATPTPSIVKVEARMKSLILKIIIIAAAPANVSLILILMKIYDVNIVEIKIPNAGQSLIL